MEPCPLCGGKCLVANTRAATSVSHAATSFLCWECLIAFQKNWGRYEIRRLGGSPMSRLT